MSEQDYPKTTSILDTEYVFRLMTAKDRAVMADFVQSLSENDLLFVRRDVGQPEAIDSWLQDLEQDRAITILAEDKGRVAGYGTLHYNQLYWNRHIAEIRVLVSAAYRKRGVGKALAKELIGLARNLQLAKVVAYMPFTDKQARVVMEGIGFKPEAVLADWVKTRDDRTHDLLIMSVPLGQ
jgi:RimJ/RimL family protein N-acetyltransferase